jgi:excisionase family DNA binding protein
MELITLNPLLTLQQVADQLGVSLSTIRRAHESGALQATRPAARCVRFTREQVLAWLASTSTSNT